MRRSVLGTVSTIPLLAMGIFPAAAQPVGGSVVAGQAQVSSFGATTVINQSTSQAIINWQDFSVGAGSAVQFNQPSAASITLNRVTGTNASKIEGAVRANGQVWLLNPNGVLFGNNARVDVGGLLATTSDLANQDFLEGRYNFAGGKNGIINKGAINASSGGSVVLSAPTVINSGLIRANAGHVVLGGTDTFTVDFHGDRLLSYAVGANSKGGSVTNTGTISAPGGTIILTAKAAQGVQDAVVNNTGMIEATSVREENGEIILEADGGSVASSGTLDASGKAAGQTGGTIKVLGKDVVLTDGASIDVSGSAGGGTVMIGGNFQGRGSEQHAQTTLVGKASIKANAIDGGNGGKVAVWSDGDTGFAGAIEARGGASGGNGGQVETSGHNLQVLDGATVTTLAPMGKSGNWLLDPKFIIIDSSGGATYPGNVSTFNSDFSGTYTISPTTIDAALAGGNVTLQANTDITVTSAAIFSAATNNTLELDAGRSIILSANLSYAAGKIIMSANDQNANLSWRDTGLATISTGGNTITASQLDLILSSNGADGSSIGTAASPVLAGNGTNIYVKTLNANVWLQSNSTTSSALVIGNSSHTNGFEVGTGTVNITASSITQSAPVIASVLNATAGGTSGALTLTSSNAVGTLNLTANGAINYYNSGNLTINGVKGNSGANAGNAVIQATGTITLANASSGTTVAASGTVVLHAGGSITQGTGTSIGAQTVSLISDAGTLGTSTAPLSINAAGLAARTFGKDQFLKVGSFNSGTSLSFSNVTSSASGLLASTSNPGINAGSGGNVQLAADSTMSVNSVTNTQSPAQTFSVTASNFQVSAASINITGASVGSLSATTSGNVVFSNSQALTINNINGGNGLTSSGSATLSASGNIGQGQSQAGRIAVTGNFTATAANPVTAANLNIVLPNTLNAINGTVSLAAVGNIFFTNSVNTILGRAAVNSVGSAPSQNIDIQIVGAGRTLTLTGSGAIINGNNINLRANGDILGTTASQIVGGNLAIASDAGSVGSSSAPIVVRSIGTLAVRAAQDITINGAGTFANGVLVPSSLNIGTVFNQSPAGGSVTGITAGGNIGLFLGPFDVFGSAGIKGKTLAISGNSIQLENVEVGSLTARSVAGIIDIGASGNIFINNTLANGFAGVQTAGTVSLNSDTGTVTQASGTAGAILAANFSVFGQTGVTLDNSSNAISGLIRMGSLGNALLVNSVATRLELGAAAGTFTVVSGGDLVLAAGPIIGSLITSSSLDVSGVDLATALSLARSDGIIVSLKSGGDGVVLSTPGRFINNFGASAISQPNGARFLIYSADPATDFFNGLKTLGPGVFGASYPAPVTASGNRYIFSVASSNNNNYQQVTTAVLPELVAFIENLQAPRRALAQFLQRLLDDPGPPPAAVRLLLNFPPPPPAPPPRNAPLADLAGPDGGNGEPPSSSDQATAYVASSLEGGPPPVVGGSGGGTGSTTIIPRYLTSQPPVPSGTLSDPSVLPGFGNFSLWQ
ncbi:MAG: filamentous hemagglutinin N-terminal domain-containing protein [Alphaproteobacteria bacterium]